MPADGKYCSLDELKAYGLGTIADPNNPTVYNGAVQGTPDDELLSGCIARAELEFDAINGAAMDEVTWVMVNAFTPFVDGKGWLHLFARENAPVTEVTAVQIRDLKGQNLWIDLSFVNDNVIYPPNDGRPHPDSRHVYIIPSVALSPRSTGEILARWTYTGGYSTIPSGIKNTIQRFAWWIYKLRESPMYQITIPSMGIMQIPLRIPPDIDSAIRLWQTVFS